jgi:hypothetical protein
MRGMFRYLADAEFQETYWKLTRLEGKPVILSEKQREPHLVVRSKENRVTGFSGCNSMTGSYTLNGNQIVFGLLPPLAWPACKEWIRNLSSSRFSIKFGRGKFSDSIWSYTTRAATC